MPVRPLLLVVLLSAASLVAQPPQPSLVLKGHTDPIYTVTISPDGKVVATGSFDKTVRLWDATTGQELRVLAGKQGHTNQVLQVTFSSKGDQLASGGSDNTAKIWDIATGSPSTIWAHDAPITGIALTLDGKAVYAAGQNGQIKSWTLADGKAGPNLNSGTASSVGLGFGPAATPLTVISSDRNLRQITLPAGTISPPIGVLGSEVLAAVVSPANGTTLVARAGVLNIVPATLTMGKALPPAPASVTGLTLSNDGTLLLMGQADKSARVVNVANSQQVQLFSNLGADVKALELLPNNQGYAIGTGDGKAHLFGADGKPRWVLNTTDKSVSALLHHPSQAQLLTAGPDGTVKVWAIPAALPKAGTPDPKPVATIKTGVVQIMTFLPNGQLMTTTAEKTLKIWDVASQKEVKAFPVLPNVVKAWTLSKDGAQLGLSLGKVVKLVTLADGKEVGLPEQSADVLSLSFNADRSKLVLGCADGVARVIEVSTGQVVQFSTAGGPITGVAFSPNQAAYLAASADKSITLNPVQTTKQVVDASIGQLLSVSATGSHYFTAGSSKGLAIWNASSNAKERTIDLEMPIRAVAQSKNGQLLAVAHGANPTITLLNYADGALIGTIKPTAAVTALAFHPTAAVLFAAQSNNRLQSWAIPYDAGQPLPNEFGKPVQDFLHPAAITSFAITPDGLNVVSGSADKQVRLWKIVSDAPAKSLPHPNLVDCVAFDKTGTQLATGCHDGTLRILDVAKGTATKTTNAHTTPAAQPIYAVIWSADGKQVVTSSFDKTIKFWDVEKGTVIREIKSGQDRFPPDPKVAQFTPAIIGAIGGSWLNAPPDTGHRDQVFTLALSPNGKLLASGSSDRTVKLWDTTTGQLVRDFPNPTFKAPPLGLQPQSHPGFVHQVRFTPDGSKLVSVGTAPKGQGYLAIWSVNEGKLLVGYELPVGPIYSFDFLPQGVLLGCGSKQRFVSDSEAIVLPLPVK